MDRATIDYIANAIAVIILFAFAFAVSLVATVQLSRHLFSEISVAELRHIERDLTTLGVQPRVMLFRNEDIKRVGLLGHLSAYRCLFALMVVVTLSLSIAIVLVPILLLLGII